MLIVTGQVTCGVGVTRRGSSDGEDERSSCEAGACPAWTEWRAWAECSASCGGGVQNRQRFCTGGDGLLKEFPASACGSGQAFETRTCGDDDCPKWEDWTVGWPGAGCSWKSLRRATSVAGVGAV